MKLDVIRPDKPLSYQEGLDLQNRLVQAHLEERGKDTLILLEHTPVITAGKRTSDTDLLFSEEELNKRGVELHETNRGGEATFHGPGQLVAYPIFNLKNHQRQVKRFVSNLEQVTIDLLENNYGISAARDDQYPGVWVGREKVTAVGIAITRGITMHGFALNVNTDLSYFDMIVPCGIKDRGVTSIQKLTAKRQSMHRIMDNVEDIFRNLFNYDR